MPQNIIEKITQAYSLEKDRFLRSGDFVTITPKYAMTHDNTGAVLNKFLKLANAKIYNSKQLIFTLDHDIQNKSDENLSKYSKIENFARENDIKFFPAGSGIGHQIMCEEGFVLPNTFVVASDSHSNIYGALGALGTPIVRSDALSIWAKGKTWWKIPEVVKVELINKPKDFITGKDIILTLCGIYNKNEVLNCAIEFTGNGIKHLSIDDRFTISNMTTEWGALTGVFPFDEITEKYFNNFSNNNPNFDKTEYNTQISKQKDFRSDSDAYYSKHIVLDLSTVNQTVALPDSPSIIESINSLSNEKIKIDKAYLLSCTNARLADLQKASQIIKGRKINQDVKFYISAASLNIENSAKDNGYWDLFIEAGAITLPSGCGPCIGLGEGILEDDETAISATNRNFKGRMGSHNSKVYLASPEIVVESAINGFISSPIDSNNTSVLITLSSYSNNSKEKTESEIIKGFPEILDGNIIFVQRDNINTDAIYPGKYTYNDILTESEMKAVAMENYDINFHNYLSDKPILLTGNNFGCGSSREQAVTSLKYNGIRIIISGSVNATFQKNAINNGVLSLAIPDLIEYIKNQNTIDIKIPTIKISENISINFRNSQVFFDNQKFNFNPISKIIQEIFLCGNIDKYLEKS